MVRGARSQGPRLLFADPGASPWLVVMITTLANAVANER